ncbi:vWA domain-containing protein [Pannonibacter sp.]|uniref:vWA domain-containing protein n=1 Tax=Pannonibacter sp. TaxID=1906786 RepID=UPI003F70D765
MPVSFRHGMGTALLAACAALACPLAGARATEPAVLIIDSSGSMAERIGGETRLDAARKILTEDVARWKPGASLALVAYGHRRKSDCGDIETLSPPGPVHLNNLTAALAKLRARGKTPLSDSLRHAAGLLPETGGNILLLSDGLETCGEDPCEVARALRAANGKVFIHVIGFGLTEAESKALACIAGAGGGLMRSAEGAGDLQEAVSAFAASTGVAEPEPGQTASAAAVPTPVPTPVPTLASEPVRPPVAEPQPVPVSFVAVAKDMQTLVGVPLAWTVRAAEGGGPVYEGGGEGIALVLKPGTYTVGLKGANAASLTQVLIDKAGGLPVEVGIDLGRLDLSLIAAKGMTLDELDLAGPLDWSVTPLDGQAPLTAPTGVAPALALAPGRYAVAVTTGKREAQGEVLVPSGGRESLVLNLHLGRLRLEAALEGEAAPVLGGTELSWRISRRDETQLVVGFDAVAQPVAVLPAGVYAVILSLGGAEIPAEAEVVEGQDQTVRVSIGAGSVALEGALAPGGEVFSDWRDAQWTVRPLRVLGGAAVGPALENHAEARPQLKLMPGEWEAALVSGTATASVRFVARPGEQQTVRIDQAAGRLTMAAQAASGEASVNILISVFGPASSGIFPEKPLFEVGVPRDYTQIVTAGRYRIIALDSVGRTGVAEVDVAPGHVINEIIVIK